MGFTTTYTEKLAKVEGDIYEWETSFGIIKAYSTGVMSGGDATIKQMESLVMTSVQDSRGTVKSLRVGEMEIPSKGSLNVVLPPPSAENGATWKANLDLNGSIFEIEYRLESVEQHEGNRAAKIVGSYASDSPVKAIEPTTFWVDIDTGKMITNMGVLEVIVDNKIIRMSSELKRF